MNEAGRREDRGVDRLTAWLPVLNERAVEVRRWLLVTAAVMMAAAIFLPLWGMTLVSIQYPEGLRMLIYPDHIVGDIAEINVLNHYIGMAEISDEYFEELRIIPVMFLAISIAILAASLVRRIWITALPLVLMASAAGYGFWSMRRRLYEYGNDLDPMAAISIEPFTPPMFGYHVLAQFGTYAYFSWGTFLPVTAGVLVTMALWLDVRNRRAPLTHEV